MVLRLGRFVKRQTKKWGRLKIMRTAPPFRWRYMSVADIPSRGPSLDLMVASYKENE